MSLIFSPPYDSGRIPCHYQEILYVFCHYRACADDTFFPHICHNHRTVSDPCIFADNYFFKNAALLLYRHIRIVKTMLPFAAHNMDIAAQCATIFNSAFSDIAIRPDVNPLAYFRICLRENRAEENGAFIIASGHGEAIKAFSQIISGYSRQQTQQLRTCPKRTVFISEKHLYAVNNKQRKDNYFAD